MYRCELFNLTFMILQKFFDALIFPELQKMKKLVIFHSGGIGENIRRLEKLTYILQEAPEDENISGIAFGENS